MHFVKCGWGWWVGWPREAARVTHYTQPLKYKWRATRIQRGYGKGEMELNCAPFVQWGWEPWGSLPGHAFTTTTTTAPPIQPSPCQPPPVCRSLLVTNRWSTKLINLSPPVPVLVPAMAFRAPLNLAPGKERGPTCAACFSGRIERLLLAAAGQWAEITRLWKVESRWTSVLN